MLIVFILVASTVIQLIATVLAARLVFLTNKHVAWTFFAFTSVLMVLRRLYSLYIHTAFGVAPISTLDVIDEASGGLISFAMLVALAQAISFYESLEQSAATIEMKKNADKALAESESRFRLLAENATDVIWSVDLNLQTTYVSPSVQSLLGYTAEEAIRIPLQKVCTPVSFRSMAMILQQEMAREQERRGSSSPSRIFDLELIRKDGRTVFVEVHSSFLRGSDDHVIGTLAIARDITERKKTTEEIRNRSDDVERMNKFLIGRELKMMEMKKKLEELEKAKT